jgi:hypothetical protein
MTPIPDIRQLAMDLPQRSNPDRLRDAARVSHATYQRKRALVLRWIGTWRFTTPHVVQALLGYAYTRTAADTLATFKNNSYLARYTNSIFAMPQVSAFTLTPTAAILAPELDLPATLPSRTVMSRYFGRPSIHHEIATQLYLAKNGHTNAVRPVASDESIPTPDALFGVDNLTALEIELNSKSNARLYEKFVRHVEAIAAGAYAHVHYVFPSSDIAASYRSRFAETEWPRFVYDTDTQRYIHAGVAMSVPPDHPMRSRFTFETSPLWPSHQAR